MNTRIKFIFLSLLLGFSSLTSFSQAVKHQEKNKFSIEVDPTTFIFNGYSIHLRLQPASSRQMLYGIGIYAMDMPDLFVDMNSKNSDKGWEVRINRAFGLFAEYHFNQVNDGLFLGTQLGAQEYLLENKNHDGDATNNSGLLMLYGGYTLQPFEIPLYFKIWGGIGYNTKIDGENKLGDFQYDIAPITGFATLHLGYTF